MEILRTFDENYHYIGDENRDVVHREGLWHETFHCWLIDEEFIYIQKRSANKKDFPSLFDITAAGHLEADETIKDGIREIKEELGIQVGFSSLIEIGVIRDVIELPNFYDYEFAHVYLYQSTFKMGDFSLQKEEVDGIYKIRQNDFIDLCLGKIKQVNCISMTDLTEYKIGIIDFVPHPPTYFKALAEKLKMLSLAKTQKI